MPHEFTCPKCNTTLVAPFLVACPACGFTLGHLLGQPSPEGEAKQLKHNELLTSGSISLYGGELNASFDYYGFLSLPDLVRYTVSYGHHATVPSPRGHHHNPVVVAYVPEIIGSGVSRYSTDYNPCSGLCIISPGSERWGHPFPVLEQWVQQQFPGVQGTCAVCGANTPFGHTLCHEHYANLTGDWRKLL